MKCPKCGSEYYSNSPTCFACSELEQPLKKRQYHGRRRILAQLVGGALCSLGVFLVLRSTELVPEDAWKGLSSFGVFVASLGAVVVSYSLLNTQTSLKEYREGKEPSNRAAAGVAATGFGAMVFATGYVTAAYYVGFSSMSYEAFSSLLLLSIVLILSSLLRQPRFLFSANEVEMSASARTVVGFSLLLAGFIVQVITFIYGYWRSLNVLLVGWVWFLLIGPFFVIAGLVVLWGPMGRPWIPGGYERQNADDGKR